MRIPGIVVLRTAVLAAFALCSTPAGAIANQAQRWSLLEDNDGMITHDDRHYTQGLRIADLLPATAPGGTSDQLFDAVGTVLPGLRPRGDGQRRIEWIVLGQSIFTPTDTERNPPAPADRPYAGWLYTGASLLQARQADALHGSLDSLEALAGVVGPWSLARQAQNSFHKVFGFGNAYGWTSQLANRAAVQFSYDHRQRYGLALPRGYAVDAVPEAGLSLGNVLRYADAGVTLRIGNALAADFGPDRIRPAPSGSAYLDERQLPAGRFGFYAFLGAQLRWTGYNLFIDGSATPSHPGLDRRSLVTDGLAGVSLLFGREVRADFTATRRSREFATQNGDDIFGSASLTVRF